MKIKSSYIVLEELNFYSYHGVGKQETKVGNKYVINLKLKVNIEKAAWSDDVEDTINYAEVTEVVRKEMAIPSKLIEHVSYRIVNALFNNFDKIEEISLTLKKNNPPMGADIASANICLNCSRD